MKKLTTKCGVLDEFYAKVYDFNIVFSFTQCEHGGPVVCTSVPVVNVRASKFNRWFRCFPQFLHTNDRALPHVEARPHASALFSNNYSLFAVC